MSNPAPKTPPPDQPQRRRALDPANSVLVQAPAGSGKTDLLTRRFLSLLTQVEDSNQIVAITFTKAAAAEMRHRILSKLEEAAVEPEGGGGFNPRIEPSELARALAPEENSDPFSIESLAQRALAHSQALGWNLLDQPAQLRISTIDSFCRDLALQQPLLSGLGDGLGIYGQPEELYRRAARQALQQIDGADPALRSAIEALLLWRDNNWQEMENLLVEMLQSRDRWMHDFVLEREQDWDALRERLERPFAKAIEQSLTGLGHLFDQVPGSRDESLALARFACRQGASALFQPLAELPDFPSGFTNADALEEAHSAYLCLAELLLTKEGSLRKQVTKNLGFPADRKPEKAQILDLIARLAAIPALESSLAAVRTLPPPRYADEDWQIVRACFTLLRNAAAQLKVVFAEAGAVDYTEVAQIALNVLKGADNQPSDAAIAVADGIHHILVDEFQDTSRRQHQLLRLLIAAWPEREGRSCFVVGDPMQSIYFFRDADAELFPRVKANGLEIPSAEPLIFDPVDLTSNFRTTKPLVTALNRIFTQVFAENDGSGVTFSPADPARIPSSCHPERAQRVEGPAVALPGEQVAGAPGLASETWDTKSAKRGPSLLPEGWDTKSAKRGSTMLPETWDTKSAKRGPSLLPETWDTESAKRGSSLLPEGAVENSPGQVRSGGRSPGNAERLGSTSPVGASETPAESPSNFELHINFTSQMPRNKPTSLDGADDQDAPQASQIAEIVALIQSRADRMEQARAAGENYRIAVLGRTRNALAPIAQALREAKIPFRAVDLEKLSARPEVLDALALARALLNPLDRVSWLGILRAPWCGLSLSDLHILASADDPELLARPVPGLLTERISLLSKEGRQAANRVLEVLSAVPALRFAQPAASLGTWLEQVWLRLGGAQCVDPAAHANLDLLWQCLDSLPNGEQDLLGPALDAALKTLTAQPDPQAGSECGVHLMTIHKSKGLEFEVVIVPELQAGSARGKSKMLSWLERGLPPEDTAYQPDGSQEVTEFLVAPLQSKGADRGTAKQWVDRVYRQRESQETRRILYVAATRARDELHLFARPACKQDKNGDWTLAEPKDSLLATAWPALHQEIEERFDAWKVAIPELEANLGDDTKAASGIIESLAASATSNLVVMPAPAKPTHLRRLPADFKLTSSGAPGPSPLGTGDSNFYTRHQGGLLSRALGTAVHSLLESLAHLRRNNAWEESRPALQQLQPRITARIRAAGIDPSKAADLAAEALRLVLAASNDPTGNWILSPHPEDSSEVRWTGVVAGVLRTVQVDRLFRAGLNPLSAGNQAWWIVDYKTAHADTPSPAAALPQLRATFAPQLEAYAEVLRNLHGTDAPLRAGLYYPRMLLFDWWEI
jgi:ATP-dependent exoDNAse (exonuclease V) beta subunit